MSGPPLAGPWRRAESGVRSPLPDAVHDAISRAGSPRFPHAASFSLREQLRRFARALLFTVGSDPVVAPALVRVNTDLARLLGIDPDALMAPDGVAVLAGNRVPPGSTPIALAYAGHQFGHFVPRLGDGRAILLGEVVDRDGARRDIQLKGSGPTPFSREGDGRAALGPVLREYLISEAMASLGVPTTRSLAVVTTGEPVYRETVLPGAILTRVAASHIRVGTFQYFAARGDVGAVRLLADYTIARHDPEASEKTLATMRCSGAWLHAKPTLSLSGY